MIQPSLPDFLSNAKPGMTSPVWMDLLGDLETPLSAYWKLSHDEEVSFLLESVTGGEQLARYSVLGVRPRAVLRTKGRRILRNGNDEPGASGSPFDLLRRMMRPAQHVEGLPKFCGGLVGFIGYDAVRFLEHLPKPPPDDLGADDVHMLDCACVVVFDHAKNLIKIIYNAEPTADGYGLAIAEIERIAERLREPLPSLPGESETLTPGPLSLLARTSNRERGRWNPTPRARSSRPTSNGSVSTSPPGTGSKWCSPSAFRPPPKPTR